MVYEIYNYYNKFDASKFRTASKLYTAFSLSFFIVNYCENIFLTVPKHYCHFAMLVRHQEQRILTFRR